MDWMDIELSSLIFEEQTMFCRKWYEFVCSLTEQMKGRENSFPKKKQ